MQHPAIGHDDAKSAVTFREMRTRSLESAIEGIFSRPKIRSFRACIADALWGMGATGTDVATLLGHANELHPFGPASIDSVFRWADRIRPLVGRYLDERGWRPVPSPLTQGHQRSYAARTRLPNFDLGDHSYEGRNRESQLARERAKTAVVQVLSEELIGDPNQEIDGARVDEIYRRIQEQVGGDRRTKDSVLRELAKEIGRLKNPSLRASAAKLNLLRQDPSPVAITFGRHLEIASAFRREWVRRVGLPIGGPMDLTERCAQFAISLVVHAAVLDPARVQALTIASLGDDPGSAYPEIVIFRANIKTPRFEYEYAVAGDSISTSLWLGIQAEAQRLGKSDPGKRDIDAEIRARISLIMDKVLGKKSSSRRWTLGDLSQLFRAWWFTRLPGSLYSIAVGDHNGPALHISSERSLFSSQEPVGSVPLPANVGPRLGRQNTSADIKSALGAINKFEARARGLMSLGTAHTRRQRSELVSQMAKLDSQDELSFWIEQESIVGLVIEFLKHLVEYGGPRKKHLRFNSIDTYSSRLFPALVREGWGHVIEDWEEGDFEAFYPRVLDSANDKHPERKRLLLEFHQFLRSATDAPYVSSFPNLDAPQRCRTSFVTVSAREGARKLVASASAGQAGLPEQASALLGLAFDYGLRSAEAAGVEVEHFDSQHPEALAVKKNVVRDLKTEAGRRFISSPCPNSSSRRILAAMRTRAANAPGSQHFLFGSAARNEKIRDHHASIRIAIRAMRAASNNEGAVYHDGRGTMATEVCMAIYPRLSQSAPFSRAMERIVRAELSADGAIQAVIATGKDNPFALDAAARTVGHASVDTLLNVYFRTSCVVLGAYVRESNLDVKLTDGQLAEMLGLSRTAISKRRAALGGASGDAAVSLQQIIQISIGQHASKAPRARITSRRIRKGKHSQAPAASVRWELLDSLLSMRQNANLTLADLRRTAESDWSLDGDAVGKFIERYQQVVTEAGFDDFEPATSELVFGKPRRSAGVERGQAEREASLSRANDLYRSNKEFALALESVCQCWFERVDSARSRFVCRTKVELLDLLRVLRRIGIEDAQLKIATVGTLPEDLLEALASIGTANPILSGDRASRGNRNVKVDEVVVDVGQLANAKAGDGRDLHRLVCILSCCIGMERNCPQRPS